MNSDTETTIIRLMDSNRELLRKFNRIAEYPIKSGGVAPFVSYTPWGSPVTAFITPERVILTPDEKEELFLTYMKKEIKTVKDYESLQS